MPEITELTAALRRAEHEVVAARARALQDPSDEALKALAALERVRLEAEGAVRAGARLPAPRIADTRGADERMVLGADTTGLEVTVVLRAAQVAGAFVNLLSATTHPLVEVTVAAAGAREWASVRVSSWVEGLSATAVETVEVKNGGPTAAVLQLPTFHAPALSALRDLGRATLHVLVEDLAGPKSAVVRPEVHRSVPIWVLPRTTAVLWATDPVTRAPVDLTAWLGAWVTPNADAVMRFLGDVVKKHPEQSIAGYQLGAPAVEAQVKAVYEALAGVGFGYVHSVTANGQWGEGGSLLQRVRLPEESLANRTMNCIDATVLFASLLEAASLTPGIVLVPGHAFLAWRLAPGGDWDFLEATMIPTHDFAAARDRGRALAAKQQAMAKLLPGSPQFVLHALPDLRARGIFPMG